MIHPPPPGADGRKATRWGQVIGPRLLYFFGVGSTMLLARLVMISRAS